MDELPKESLKLAYTADNDALKYISGLSTILVATIQETKDKISQIEYIFCTQLYQHFQFNSKGLQKKVVGDSCKDEKTQIEKLKLDMKYTLEQNHLLQAEKDKLKEEYEGKVRQQCARLTSLEGRIDELETELISKSQEVDEGIKLQKTLQDLVQAKGSAMVDLDKQLRVCETRASTLLADLNAQVRENEILQDEVNGKALEYELEKELRENLLEKLELQARTVMKTEDMLSDCDEERAQLAVRFSELKESFGELSNELRRKTVEVDEAKKISDGLLNQIDLSKQVTLKNEKQMENLEKEKKLLLTKVKDLENEVNRLQLRLGERCSGTLKESDPHKELLQQIQSKSVELMAEKKKNRSLFDGYKRLKSQYIFLLKKVGLTEENMKSLIKLEVHNISVRHDCDGRFFSDIPSRIPDIPETLSDMKTVKNEFCSDDNIKDGKEGKSAIPQSPASNFCNMSDIPSGIPDIPETLSDLKTVKNEFCSGDNIKDGKEGKGAIPESPASNICKMRRSPSSPKSDSITGKKHPASGWRGTRSTECRGGTDCHDDFLGTPLENIKGKLRKVEKEQTADPPFPILEDRAVDSSDDETQDMNVEQRQKQQILSETGDKKSFKYVEPVRKREEREKLKGYECKQCKKFYDAVLDERGKDKISDKNEFRCEHHDGVSRHRYRYAPPLTPEGFWNIGFESEM